MFKKMEYLDIQELLEIVKMNNLIIYFYNFVSRK